MNRNVSFCLAVLLLAMPFASHSAQSREDSGTAASKAVPSNQAMKVVAGVAELICNISSKENGVQKLTFAKGGGVEFDAVVGPLVDGTVEQRGTEKGARYSFTSHLAKPATGRLAGIGDVTISSLTTRVSVEVKRYQQTKAGAPFTFSTGDFVDNDVYVEFVGIATKGKDKFNFTITLGQVEKGEGKVHPLNENFKTTLLEKQVKILAKATTIISPIK